MKITRQVKVVTTIKGTPRTLGERALVARVAKGWSQRELAKEAGIATYSVVWSLEKDKEVLFSSVSKIAAALGVSLDYLATGKVFGVNLDYLVTGKGTP